MFHPYDYYFRGRQQSGASRPLLQSIRLREMTSYASVVPIREVADPLQENAETRLQIITGLLASVSEKIATMTRLCTRSKDSKIDDSFLSHIKAASPGFNPHNQISCNDILTDMRKTPTLLAHYQQFDLTLQNLKAIDNFFAQPVQSDNKEFLQKYNAQKEKYEPFRAKVTEIVERCNRYHAFVQQAIQIAESSATPAARP